jgi:prepilin-type N-terminal cleavage/methylation domain-containing protein
MHMMPPTSHSPTRLRSRRGFTIVEVLVVSIILAMVGGMLMNMLFKQQQFYNGTTDLMQLRGQLRQAEAILGSDLRGVSPGGNEITAMTDSSIDFRYTYGSSILCSAPNNNASTVVLPPTTRAVGAPLTVWLNTPDTSDVVYILDDKVPTVLADDEWIERRVGSVVQPSAGLCGAPYTTVADASTPSYVITLDNGISSTTVRQGAVVRFARNAHYSLYRSSTDGRWYLGYCNRTCNTTTNLINPIAGPFLSYDPTSGSGTSGLRFTYYDNVGAQITGTGSSDRARVSRVSIVMRGQTRGRLSVDGLARGVYTDSLRFDIALRNNR